MEKTISASGSGGTTAVNCLFIDTSLDTHLVISVSDSETVSDIKKKILYEHQLLFPNMGGIEIHSLKVKRKGQFYHLSDSLSVKVAFNGFNKSWFLFLDASSLGNQSYKLPSRKPDSTDSEAPDGLTNYPSADMLLLLCDGPSKGLYGSGDSLSLETQTEQHAKQNPSTEHNKDDNCNLMLCDIQLEETQDIVGKGATEVENSRKGINDAQVNVQLEASPKTATVGQKKLRPKRKSEDWPDHRALGKNKSPALVSDKNASIENAVVPDKSLGIEDRGMVVSRDIEMEVKEIANELCKGSGNEVEMTDAQNEEKGVTGERVECEKKNEVVNMRNNLPPEETSPVRVVNKKQKTLRKSKNENPSKEKGVLRCRSTKETLQNNDSKSMALAKCTSSNMEEMNINLKEVIVSSSLLDANINKEPEKSAKKRKKSTKIQDSSAVTPVNQDAQNTTCSVSVISSADPLGTVYNDLSTNKSKEAENTVETREVHDEMNVNSKEVIISSSLLDANANTELEKSKRKRKKSTKTQDLSAVTPVNKDAQNTTCSVPVISSTEPLGTVYNDLSSNKSKEAGGTVVSTEGEVAETETVKTTSLATDRETDNVIHNVLESLQDMSNPVNVETKDEKSKKTIKRKKTSTAKSLSKLQKEDENINCNKVTQSNGGLREVEVDPVSKAAKKAKLVESSSKQQSKESDSKSQDGAVVKNIPLDIQLNPDTVKSSQPPQVLKSDVTKSGFGESKVDLSCESDGTIVNDNFVPSQEKPEIVASGKSLVDKATKTRVGNGIKAMEDKEQLDGTSNGLRPATKSSLKSNENQVNEEKTQDGKLSTSKPQTSLSKGEGDNTKREGKTKLPKASGTKGKAAASNKKSSKTENPKKLINAKASGTHELLDGKKDIGAASDSSMESSRSFIPQVKKGEHKSNVDRNHVALKKVSGNNVKGKVMSSSEKKSLLAQSGSIFKYDSAGSSDDETGVEHSDTSTRTPSDGSDYSDGDSKTPAYRTKRRGSGERNLSETYPSVNLDTILRSSSRYKAAKLTASQSQPEDSETQPDEFVPDSLPNL